MKRKGKRISLIQTQIDAIWPLREELRAAKAAGQPLGAIIGQPHIDDTDLKVTGFVKFTVLTNREAQAIADILKNGIPDDDLVG